MTKIWAAVTVPVARITHSLWVIVNSITVYASLVILAGTPPRFRVQYTTSITVWNLRASSSGTIAVVRTVSRLHAKSSFFNISSSFTMHAVYIRGKCWLYTVIFSGTYLVNCRARWRRADPVGRRRNSTSWVSTISSSRSWFKPVCIGLVYPALSRRKSLASVAFYRLTFRSCAK